MKYFFSYFFCLFFSFSLLSQEIATIKLSYLIENSKDYISFINDLESQKKSFYDSLIEQEKILNERKNEIEESKLILNNEEINKLVNDYNEDLIIYQDKIENYNFFVKNNIDTNQKIIIQEIIEIVQQISLERKFNIILNEDQYFISSESIDISKLVLEKLNNKKLNLKIIND